MVTVAVELSRALVANRGQDEFVLLCSRERPASLADLDCEAVLAPYRHELVLKSRWLPTVEPLLECDAILYPYWPSPPFRRPAARARRAALHHQRPSRRAAARDRRPAGLGIRRHAAKNRRRTWRALPRPRRRADAGRAVRVGLGACLPEPL